MNPSRYLTDGQDVTAAVLRYLEQDKDMAAMILGLAIITVCVIVAIVAGMRDSARRRRTPRRRRRRSQAPRTDDGPTELQTPDRVISASEQDAFDAITAHLPDLQRLAWMQP